TATGSSSTVSLSWSAPASDGGSAITNYRIYRGTTSGGESLLTTAGNVTSYTDTTLTNGTTYYNDVAEGKAVGTGGPPNGRYRNPATAPGAPTIPTATAGSGSVALAWSAPASNGGTPITGYRIYRGTTSGGESLLTTTGNVTSYTDSGLANGT